MSHLIRRLVFVLSLILPWLPVADVVAQDGWPDLSVPPKAEGGGEKDAAVVVGAEKYAFVDAVPGARQNAADWQAYLTGALRVPFERVNLLRDEDATVEDIRQYAAKAAREVREGGTLWFVFIGHGAPSKDAADGLLVGIDAQQKLGSIYGRSIPRNELLEILSKGKQSRTVVILDACFSGKSRFGASLVEGLQPLVSVAAAPRAADSRTVLLAAARSDEFAGSLPRSKKQRPAFSYLALGALRGWAAGADGKVTAAGIIDYARKALALARDRTQTPELAAGLGATVLGLGTEPPPDLARIDREASQAREGFRISAESLPAVPTGEAPKALPSASAGVLDFRGIDLDAMERYSAMLKMEKESIPAEQKAANWRKFGKEVPKFVGVAERRAAEWDRYVVDRVAIEDVRRKRLIARNADWEKLFRILDLDNAVVSQEDKERWSADFVNAYLKLPGIEPSVAKKLLGHIQREDIRRELDALAQKAHPDFFQALEVVKPTELHTLRRGAYLKVSTKKGGPIFGRVLDYVPPYLWLRTSGRRKAILSYDITAVEIGAQSQEEP